MKTTDRDTSLRLLKTFTQAHGAPGQEDAVREAFVSTLPAGFSLESDGLGSVVATRPGPDGAPRVLLGCHMDEVGFMVQSITSAGFLQIVPLGGWWNHTLLAQRVRLRRRDGTEILGVISSTPPHLLPESQRNAVLGIEQIFVDVGAADAADAKERLGIRLGDTLVPDADFRPFNSDRLYVSKAFDNRAGCAACVQAAGELAASGAPNTLLAVATVQEEMGLRGAKTAAALARPDVAIILEGPPADDTPGASRGELQGRLGGGVQIRLFDPSAIMSRRLADLAISVAEAEGIPHQVTVRRSGGTDAGSMHLANTGIPCVVLGVPARYIHTHNAILDIADYEALVRLAVALAGALDKTRVDALRRFLP